jgi:hypothetical protein
MKSTNQMNGLYPIIRRVRRPLMPVDVLPDGHHADAEPAKPQAKGEDVPEPKLEPATPQAVPVAPVPPKMKSNSKKKIPTAKVLQIDANANASN